jgi:hypothetical protein
VNTNDLLKLQELTDSLNAAYEKRINTLEEQNELLTEALNSALPLLEAYDKMRAIRLRKLFFYQG